MAVNPTIGQVKCPFTGELAEVRKDKKGKLYFVSAAGMIRPNLPPGQEWILENATMFNQPHDEPPAQFGRRLIESEIKVEKPTEPKPKTQPEKVPEPVDEDDDDWLPW